MRVAAFALLCAGCFNPKPYDSQGLGFYCNPMVDVSNPPSCPDGQSCMQQTDGNYRCVIAGAGPDMAGTSLIPKTGMYTGAHNDPMLNMVSLCPDASLEPNDTPGQAVPAPAPMPDAATPKITKMAICPTGPRPETGMHDIDLYVVDTTTLASSGLTMMAEIFYDVSFGDLDVGIFDHSLKLLASDGSAVTNGCTAAQTMSPDMANPGNNKYYVMVVGANNMDVNRYDIRIRTFSQSKLCPTAAPTDM